jgi:SH3-like domain-containing protein
MTTINDVTNGMVLLLADTTLRKGDTGNEVKTLQTLLNYRGAGLTVDGIFGAITEDRVREFQQAMQLVSDGIVGARTWTFVRLGVVVARIPGSAINMRINPDRTAAVVQTLSSNDSVTILNRSTLLNESYRWFQVRAKQMTGWVRKDLVHLLNPFTIPLPIVNGVTIQSRPRPWLMDIDPAIEAGIRAVLRVGASDRIRYMYRPLDFDGTSSKGLMLVYLPGIGGTGGSTMLVLQARATGYQLITRMSVVQQPVVINNQSTNGCADLIVFTAGGGSAAAYRRLRFDGSSYPTNPTVEPALPAGTVAEGIALASRITPDLAAPLVAV